MKTTHKIYKKLFSGENSFILLFTSFFLSFLYVIYTNYINVDIPLTKEFLHISYDRFSSYKEHYYDTNQYINAFPVSNYSVYKINHFASFYLEKNKQDIIKSRLRAGKRWEEPLTKLMKHYVRKGSNVIDVGAHIGTHTTYFSQLLGGTGIVYAFEPQLKLFVELNANLLLNHAKNVKTYRYAIGDKNGSIEMSPSLLGNEGGTYVGQGGDKADVITLDSLHLRNVSFIKIDVESYEDHVLNGARETILKNKPVILCEIQGGDPNPFTAQKIMHTKTLLKNLGYQIHQVGPSDYLALPA